MAKLRTWIIVIVSVVGFFVVCLLGFAGATTYWVLHHISTRPASSSEAVRTFDETRAQFNNEKPLISTDDLEHSATVERRLADMPSSAVRPTEMHVLVWQPDDERTVNISLPFWVLKLGKKKIDLGSSEFNFERFRIDPRELERIGPKLLADFQRPGGERVLVWTR